MYYVYKYVVKDEIIYIGLTNNIVRRVHEHASANNELEAKFQPYLDDCEIYYHICGNKVEMRSLESLLININKPILNVTDVEDGESTIKLDIEWTLFDSHITDSEDNANRAIRKNIKEINAFNTRIKTYKRKRDDLLKDWEVRKPFYRYLNLHKDDIIRLHQEEFGIPEKEFPFMGKAKLNKKEFKCFEYSRYDDGILWAKFDGDFLREFFAVSSENDWFEKIKDQLCDDKIDDIEQKIKQLKYKIERMTEQNTELKEYINDTFRSQTI